MNKYTVINDAGDYPHQVHKAGCQDISRKMRQGNYHTWDFEAETVMDGIVREVGDENDKSTLGGMGFGVDSFELAPCVK